MEGIDGSRAREVEVPRRRRGAALNLERWKRQGLVGARGALCSRRAGCVVAVAARDGGRLRKSSGGRVRW